MLIDIHAHLYDYDDDALNVVVKDATVAGVDTIVNSGISIDTSRIAAAQCARFPANLKAAVGVSPFDSGNVRDGWADELKELLSPANNPHVVALGEIGLDCTNPRYPSLDTQTPVFMKQLDIAMETDMPVILHSRGMEMRVAEICRSAGVSKAVFHCFTGDRETMEYIISCGYYISISGIVTYKNSHLRDMIQYIPPDKLLLETDAPYLSPVPHRGKQNVPAFLVHTARYVADLMMVDMGELSETLRKNTARIFRV